LERHPGLFGWQCTCGGEVRYFLSEKTMGKWWNKKGFSVANMNLWIWLQRQT
jgi:hypothetical protein